MQNRRQVHRHKSNSPYLIVFTSLAFILGMAVGYLIWGGNDGTSGTSDTVRRVTVSTDGDPSVGPENAPVTIIEFSDYQCPYCKAWYDQVYSQLMAAYPNQIRFVYRDYPLPGHAEAKPAAEAAECAGAQGKYWEFHDALFSDQYAFGRAGYEQYAADLGLDMASFTTCLDEHTYKSEVEGDALDAAKAGINSTPSFVINGRVVVGALPLSDFVSIIDEELNSK